MKFYESLADLKNHVGSRNSLILSVAIRGINEGMTPDAVAEAFASADCGDPPLNEQEVSRAISRAKEYVSGEPNTNAVRFSVAMKKMAAIREGTSPEERGFVRRMIEIGRKAMPQNHDKDEYARQLMKLSPIKTIGIGNPTRTDIRRYMVTPFVRALYGDDVTNRVFATDNIRAPRDASRVFKTDDLITWLTTDELLFKTNVRHFNPLELFHSNPVVPTHICANMVSGENVPIRKGGAESYANKNTVATYTNALIEFDLLELNDQALFWYGVIKSESLDVVSIVHTGNKSLHGIVRVEEMTSGDDLFGTVTREAKQQKWAREWEKIMRICCSDEDVNYRCDAACRDPTRMTRFPGGLRDHVTEQLLVYCKAS